MWANVNSGFELRGARRGKLRFQAIFRAGFVHCEFLKCFAVKVCGERPVKGYRSKGLYWQAAVHVPGSVGAFSGQLR
mgnify:CR=1 FL=1